MASLDFFNGTLHAQIAQIFEYDVRMNPDWQMFMRYISHPFIHFIVEDMEDYSSSISSSDDDIDLDDDEYKLADDVFNGFSNLNDEPAQLATRALPGTLEG